MCCVFQAELWGVFEGLSLIRRLGLMKVELSMDSTLIVKAIEMVISKDMDGYSLIKQIHKLIKMHEEVKVVHSYREAN